MQFNLSQDQKVNLSKLHDELLASNLIEPTDYFGSDYFVVKDDADMQLIQQIVDIHNPTPIPPAPTDKERIEQLENMILMMMEVI